MSKRSSSRRTGVVPAPVPAAAAKTQKETEKVDTLFARYAEKNDDKTIGPEGIELLCKDLCIEPSDFRALLLAWKLQAKRQGYFTLEEWRKGLKAMRVDTIDKLNKALTGLKKEVSEKTEDEPFSETLKDVYVFAFQYCLTEPMQKTLDLETACAMIQLVLEGRSHVLLFIQFLQIQKEYKVLTLDQWTGFLRFCEEVEDDLADYDDSQAWPLLLDNYVEWALKSKEAQ